MQVATYTAKPLEQINKRRRANTFILQPQMTLIIEIKMKNRKNKFKSTQNLKTLNKTTDNYEKQVWIYKLKHYYAKRNRFFP